MPTRIFVPGPEPIEESRQIAESVADAHYVLGTIVEDARGLIPGESVDELINAWPASEDSMKQLVSNLISSPPEPTSISHETLEQNQLTGEVGRLKRSTFRRLIDRFFMFWRSEPRNDEKRKKATEAAMDCCDFAATFLVVFQALR
jgi:hypothetical protein